LDSCSANLTNLIERHGNWLSTHINWGNFKANWYVLVQA